MSVKGLRFALALAGLVAITGAAGAQSSREETHGRRAEVNDRLAHQNDRIREERREHELSVQRAQELRRHDHAMRTEERSMASRNSGHITPSEQQTLNRQENHESREIGR